jgi:hypothetical protein
MPGGIMRYRQSLHLAITIISVFVISRAASVEAANPTKMTISISGRTVSVSGASSGSEVLVFGAYQDTVGYISTYGTCQQFVADDDRDGAVTATFTKEFSEVPHRSVWVAIDARNGDYVVAVPTGYKLQLHDLPANAIAKSKTGDDALSLSMGSAAILVLRPGGGVWRGSIDHGSAHDEHDLDDKKLLVSVSQLMALRGRDRGPQTLLPSDIIVAINPFTLETFMKQVGK